MPRLSAGLPSERATLRRSSGRELDVRDFAQAHQVAAFAAADDQLAEILRRVQARVGAQRELALARLDAAGGQLDVLGAQRVLDVLRR